MTILRGVRVILVGKFSLVLKMRQRGYPEV